jgi:MerR, DNA binding.
MSGAPAKRLGFTLAEIEELFALSAHQRSTGELREQAAAKIREIDDWNGQTVAEIGWMVLPALQDRSIGSARPRARAHWRTRTGLSSW